MKRRDLEQHLRAHGCFLHRSVGPHDVWINPATQKRSPIPRHRELKTSLARGVCRILGIPDPPGK